MKAAPGQCQDLHEAREAVVHEGAVEKLLGGGCLARDQKGRTAQHEDCDNADGEARFTPVISAPKQENHRGQQDEQLWENRSVIIEHRRWPYSEVVQ